MYDQSLKDEPSKWVIHFEGGVAVKQMKLILNQLRERGFRIEPSINHFVYRFYKFIS
jgi:hypothetical protein